MIRLNMVVEGQTEETFVRDVLAPYLAEHNVFATARRVEFGRRKIGPRQEQVYRGGLLEYGNAREDLHSWMKQDANSEARFTTMFDLYALPDDFPGAADARLRTDLYERVGLLEQHLADDVGRHRFVPYIQTHEFEALLFSDAGRFAEQFPGRGAEIASLAQIATEFLTPEHIDDGTETAPSKRILRLLPDYRKPLQGPIIAAAIGLATIRAECPHFHEWLTKLEGLGQLA